MREERYNEDKKKDAEENGFYSKLSCIFQVEGKEEKHEEDSFESKLDEIFGG